MVRRQDFEEDAQALADIPIRRKEDLWRGRQPRLTARRARRSSRSWLLTRQSLAGRNVPFSTISEAFGDRPQLSSSPRQECVIAYRDGALRPTISPTILPDVSRPLRSSNAAVRRLH